MLALSPQHALKDSALTLKPMTCIIMGMFVRQISSKKQVVINARNWLSVSLQGTRVAKLSNET